MKSWIYAVNNMKAIIELNGVVHEVHEYEGDSPGEIVFQLYRD